jgi:hypothetical protein
MTKEKKGMTQQKLPFLENIPIEFATPEVEERFKACLSGEFAAVFAEFLRAREQVRKNWNASKYRLYLPFMPRSAPPFSFEWELLDDRGEVIRGTQGGWDFSETPTPHWSSNT